MNTEQMTSDAALILNAHIASVKDLRREIAGCVTAIHTHLTKSREVSLAITKLEEASMWLGKELQRIGELHPDLLKDPYPTSRDSSVGTIDPPAKEIAPEQPENTAGC